MGKVFLQLWERSTKNEDITPVGCTLHLDKESHISYICDYFIGLDHKVPNEYVRPISMPVVVVVSDSLFSLVTTDKNILIRQTEMSNLIQLEDIKIDIKTND